MTRVFISYSSKDKAFAERLANELRDSGINTWIDLWQIRVGDSIVSKIQTGLSESDYVVAVLSTNSISSRWVQEELNSVKIRELEQGRKVILPVLIEKCKIPPFLADKKYANFCFSYQDGLTELLTVLGAEITPNTQDLLDVQDFKMLVMRTLALLTKRLRVHSVHILFHADEHHAVRLLMVGAALDERSQRFRFATTKGIIGYCYHHGEQINLPDVSKDERYFSGDNRTLSELATPIKTLEGVVIGVINLESSSLNAFNEEDAMFVQKLADAFAAWCAKNGLIVLEVAHAPYWEMQ